MTFIVATNVIASRPPERRPTGTLHARAKSLQLIYLLVAPHMKVAIPAVHTYKWVGTTGVV